MGFSCIIALFRAAFPVDLPIAGVECDPIAGTGSLTPPLWRWTSMGFSCRVGEKLQRHFLPEGDLGVVLESVRGRDVESFPLSAFERSLVRDAQQHL